MAPSRLIEPKIISPDDFNTLIPHIHDQKEFPADTLEGLQSIYRKHQVQNKYGCQLLHRHYDMPAGSIALTTEIDKSISVTKVTPLATTNLKSIRGQLYLLNEEGKFHAYEYEYGAPVSFPDAFLNDLAAFIQKNGLHDKLAITSSIYDTPTAEIQIGSEATITFLPKETAVNGNNEQFNISAKPTVFNFRDQPREPEPIKPQPGWVICGGYWTSHGGWCGFYIGEPDRQIAKKKRDKDAQQKDSDGTAEKSGGGEHDTGVLGKFPSSEPFDFDKYDIKEVLREAGLM